MKLFSKIFILLLTLGLFYSCSKDDATGMMTVRMTDDPADYMEVNVDVQAVQIHYEDDDPEEWVTLETNRGIYNLLDLQNDITVVITDQDEIRVGYIEQMRLVLGQENTLVTTTDEFPLLLSSQDKTGLKVNVNAQMKDQQHMEIVLDFDAGESVVEEGNDQYRLKPVVKVESITYK
ncbi:MAG: DUF4382 domain-containing protein [Crocinitomicaceae bacterium]|nr:DUF4382 domain-containing protein [Crocinitomicaceae bacterium]